ncbi:hypothetical protein [Actinoplanes sp. NBRC 101535]|uniref:hypothetical protein n=1 Tax=Actinoplanes sp. NBRC 101535 TaxID=3032196 RepID=UPI002552B9A3|nr:hypothetical protein [Actinoplanes sp. NBRC 101535]
MSALHGLTRWAVDAAARRWPAEIRDEMAREWHAEMAAIEAEPGGARQAFAFAFSLLTAPPVHDRSGAPRGWSETTGPMAPAAALMLAGLLIFGFLTSTFSVSMMLLAPLGVEMTPMTWPVTLIDGAVAILVCVPAGRWLGRRMPIDRIDRFGPATSVFFAPLLLAPVIYLLAVTGQEWVFVVGLLVALVVWAPAIAVLGVAAVRARRRTAVFLILLGTPLISVLAAVAGTLPMVVSSADGLSGGLRAAEASLLYGTPTPEYEVIVDGLSGRAFYWFGPWAVTLVALAALALTFGLAAVRPLPRRMPVAATAEQEPAVTMPAAVVAVGSACLTLGVVAWAYTLAILDPAMPVVSRNAPMPGGDGEIYLWVAELRWTAILIAALGMLIAAADRRRATPSAVVLAVNLLALNGVLMRLQPTGATGLQITLLLGAVAIALAWFVAGGRLDEPRIAGALRRRVAAGAVLAAACGPLILSQGTPGVNHPYLPAGLQITTTGLAVLGVLLAMVPAVVLSRYRLPVWAAITLIVLPVALVVAAGTYPVDTGSEDTGYGLWGALAGVPVAVVVLWLLRRHRSRRRGRTVAVWTALTLAGIPGVVVLFLAGLYLGAFAPNMLFIVEGSGYPADGLSIVPGAALLLLPLAAVAAARIDGRPAVVAEPGPGWQPVTDVVPG